jgi:multicomponent Na+:H+ antiporter subunit B
VDLYVGILEMKRQEELGVNEKLKQKHKKDQEKLFRDIYDQENNWVYKAFLRFYKLAAVVCCIALIVMLVVTVSYLPPVGNPDNPAHNEVVEKYVEDGMQDTGAVNIVAGMILDYRAFDTFGESNVLFIATVVVMLLMRDDNRKKGVDSADMKYEQRFDTILQQVTFILFPLIMIFGIYVVVNGHLSPGGGFSGGAIMGAGLILYLNAFGIEKMRRFFTENTHKYVCFAALSFYCLAKSYSFFTGANHLDSIISTGIPGMIVSAGLILPLNICVGLVVACTMYSFYTLFRKGGY